MNGKNDNEKEEEIEAIIEGDNACPASI